MKFSLIAIIAFFLSACSSGQQTAQAPPPPSLPVASISSRTEITYQEYPASIEGTVNVEIRPQVSGSLERVFVDEGAYVSAGSPLFKINDQPYRAQLNNALAALHGAEAALINTQLEIEKLTPLVQNKVVSDYQLRSARAANQAAKAGIEAAKANVSTARINLGYTVIKAPVSGYIGRLLKKQGSLVAPGEPEPLTELSDVHEVHVYFSLGEQDFITFKEQYRGATLSDKLTSIPPVSLLLANDAVYDKPGKIDVINGHFDKTTGAITIRATFPNPQGLLRAGNTGKVKLGLLHADALIVPESATVEMQDKVFVFTVGDSSKVKKTPITIIGKSGTNYLVKDGVKSGDQLVLSGADKLQEGTVIHPEKQVTKVVAVIKK